MIKAIAFRGYLSRNQFLHTIASFPDGLDLQEARVLVTQCTFKLTEKYGVTGAPPRVKLQRQMAKKGSKLGHVRGRSQGRPRLD